MNDTKHKIIRITATTLLFMITFTATVPTCRTVGWSADTRLTTDPAWDMMPSVMQARDGTIWVVWTSDRIADRYNLYYTTSSDGGFSWSGDTRLTWLRCIDENPSVMQVWDGTIWVVWSSDRTGNKEIFYTTSSDGGFSWFPPVQLTNNASMDTGPSITQNVDGKIWLVWHRNETGDYNLFCKYSSDYGQSWSSEKCLTTHTATDRQPSITHTENGTLWVVWQSYRAENNYELFYKNSSDGGFFWSDATRLTTDSAKADENPSVIQDVKGTMWVVWSKAEEIYCKTSLNYGLEWSSDTLLTKSPGEDSDPSITNTKERRIWVVWESTRDDFEIYYAISDEISSVHDIAIIDMKAWASLGDPATWVPQGMPIYVNVTVENQGDYPETFNVTVYADRDLGDLLTNNIETQTGITLNPGTNTTLTFTWNTLNAYSTYYISANATQVAGEYDTFDNIILLGHKIGVFPGQCGKNVNPLLPP